MPAFVHGIKKRAGDEAGAFHRSPHNALCWLYPRCCHLSQIPADGVRGAAAPMTGPPCDGGLRLGRLRLDAASLLIVSIGPRG
jgi:hypothetical protein